MIIWILALTLTAIACAALYYAGAGRMVNAGRGLADATTEHFRAQLHAIDVDAAAGRLGPAEATAAKAELAREVMRLGGKSDEGPAKAGGKTTVIVSIAAVAVLALGTYAVIGRPDLPAEPLAERAAETPAGMDMNEAIAKIEERLAADPSDLRGWKVIAPAYMQLGRYEDAVKALRHVNELSTPTADSWTDLGEALMMAHNGAVAGEALEAFRKAAALDPTHVRSRFYIAGEETRSGDFTAAARDWNELLKLAKGDEPWVVTAKNGLRFAEEGLNPSAEAPKPDTAQIDAMVDGLEARLKESGGSLEEWTQLVRSRLVQGRPDTAQADYDLARKAYPDASDREELDNLALKSGLVAK
jgi:cytochrome c-type biogenesis protein CcmH